MIGLANPPIVVSYGGGVNSTALLAGLWSRSIRPDAILFSDTGGELPATYAYLDHMDTWLRDAGFPQITKLQGTVRGSTTLEEECLDGEYLPSLAYGFKSCSDHWKRRPMDRWIKEWDAAHEIWDLGGKVVRYLGIDAGEAHRSAALCDATHKKYVYERPLIDWDWGREECFQAIKGMGLPIPGKSACWFCPATRKPEVLALAAKHPDLFRRAVALEHGARESLNVVKGLGRHWSWEALEAADRAQLKLFPEAPIEPCGCFDGEAL